MLAVILLDRSPTSPQKRQKKKERTTAHAESMGGGGGGGGGGLDREGNMMFAGRALVVASVDGSVSDQLQ